MPLKKIDGSCCTVHIPVDNITCITGYSGFILCEHLLIALGAYTDDTNKLTAGQKKPGAPGSKMDPNLADNSVFTNNICTTSDSYV